jgi:hypothetical protein
MLKPTTIIPAIVLLTGVGLSFVIPPLFVSCSDGYCDVGVFFCFSGQTV